MEKEEQKKLLRLVYTLYEVDVIEDEARNRLIYFAMNSINPQEKSTVLRDDGKQYLTEKHSLHGKRVTWSMNGFDGVGIVVDVEDDIAHIAVIDSHSTFQTYANLPIEILH